MRHSKHYLITSGTTGYLPNPSEIAVADDWHGPFQVLGNPHPEDPTNTSFGSQISSVFQVQGKKDLYIACADSWAPDVDPHTIPYAFYAQLYELLFTGHQEKIYDLAARYGLDRELLRRVFYDNKRNTSIADYVWLPLTFTEDGKVLIHWYDEWRLEDYE